MSDDNETFKVGDLVYRPRDVYANKSPIMKGVVTNIRSERGYPIVIDVEWDNDARISYGYLPHGISKSEKTWEGWR